MKTQKDPTEDEYYDEEEPTEELDPNAEQPIGIYSSQQITKLKEVLRKIYLQKQTQDESDFFINKVKILIATFASTII